MDEPRTPRRITRPPRRRPPVEEAAPEATEAEERGHRRPWVYARYMLPDGATDLSVWILHTSDCPLAPLEPVSSWPAESGDPPGSEAAYGQAEAALATTLYLNLRNEACELCKPGILLRETCPGRAELDLAWADRAAISVHGPGCIFQIKRTRCERALNHLYFL